MLNLKEELSQYIEDGSINWNRLKSIISAVLRNTEIRKEKVDLVSKDFVSAALPFSQISIQFTDKTKNTKQRLLVELPQIDGNLIFAKAFRIEPLVKAIAQETDDSETAMWIDNEWWKDGDGVVYRWIGRKSYIKEDPGYKIHLLIDVKNNETIETIESFRDYMKKVEPVIEDGETKFVEKESEV